MGSDFSFICLHSNDRSVSVVLDNCKAGGIRSYRCLPYNIMQLFEAYVKKLNPLDYDLPILNTALMNFMVKDIPVEQTIQECNDLKEFQLVSKISGKYIPAAEDRIQRVLE